MGGDDFLSALGSLTNALFLIASVYIYIALLRQINRRDLKLLATEPEFGVAEVPLRLFLSASLVSAVLAQAPSKLFACARPTSSSMPLFRSALFSLWWRF